MLLEQTNLNQKLAKQRKKQVNAQMVRKFLERIKNLAEHYLFAEPAEKRQIVKIATSNRTVRDKTVYMEPSNWLQATQTSLGVFNGGQSRPTSRRLQRVRDQQIRHLIALANEPEATEAMNLLSNNGDSHE